MKTEMLLNKMYMCSLQFNIFSLKVLFFLMLLKNVTLNYGVLAFLQGQWGWCIVWHGY